MDPQDRLAWRDAEEKRLLEQDERQRRFWHYFSLTVVLPVYLIGAGFISNWLCKLVPDQFDPAVWVLSLTLLFWALGHAQSARPKGIR